jgi:predicted MPP superfamily phosphohydrolase
MKRRLFIFITLITIILTSAYLYVASSLLVGVKPHLLFQVLLAIPFLLVWFLPAVYWQSESDVHKKWETILVWFSTLSMGFVSFILTTTVLRDLITLVLFVTSPQLALKIREPFASIVVFLLALVGLLLGMLRVFGGPRLKHVDIEFEGLPKDLHGFKIIQISDLHIGTMIQENYVQKVVDLANEACADLICLTGDIFDGDARELQRAIAPLKNLKSKYGNYYVTGNHEYYWDAAVWLGEVEKLNLLILKNQSHEHNVGQAKIAIAGVVDYAATAFFKEQTPQPETAIENVSPDTFKILMVHQPKMADRAAKAGYHLQLSGHTHGGQFFPWTQVVKLVHRYHKGLHTHDKMKVYVNPGTGFWGPPVRFGTTPEVTLIRLQTSTKCT